MKKIATLVVILALVSVLGAWAEGKTVEPLPVEIDLENVQDGIYPVRFDRATSLSDGALEVTLYSVDCYDIVDIATLQVGDTIVIDGEALTVQSLERKDDLLINGGLDEGGYELRAWDESNCWKVAGLDDYPTWTEHGTVSLPLDEAVTFTDSWDIDGQSVTGSGIEAVEKWLAQTENEFFNEANTTVRTEAGKIVEISRVYVP